MVPLTEMLPVAWKTALFFAICVWTAVWAWPRLHMWNLTKKFPGPSAWPIVGNALSFILRGNESLFKTIDELFVTHGPVVRLWFGPKLVVGIASPEDAQLILTHPKVINRDHHYNEAVNGFVNNSLLTIKDDAARARRKLISPAFHFNVLSTYMEVFGRKGDEFCDRLAKVADGRTIHIKEEISVCTLQSVAETVVGISATVDWTLEQWKDMLDLIDMAVSLAYNRLTKPWLLIDWISALTADGKTLKSMREQFLHYFQHGYKVVREDLMADEKKATLGKKKMQSISDIIFNSVEIGEGILTEDEIREESYVLFGAGTDTSANVMSYAIMLLGMHPEYQERVFEEQKAIFEDTLRPATNEDLPNMVILELVIKETLRMFPPVTVLPREIPEDLPISQGRILPAGCSVLISNFSIHRNAEYFEDPEKFWPERWTIENSIGRHPYAFLPFSAGPRNCIGQKYAQLQMKSTLSRVLRQFRFTCGYSLEELKRIEVGITNSSAVGYNVQAHVR